MCFEDVKLGRQTGARERSVPINGATITLVASADPKRTRIAFGGNTSTPMCVTTDQTAISRAAGFWLSAFFPTKVFTIEEYGVMVTWAWYGYLPVGNDNLTVAEMTLQREA